LNQKQIVLAAFAAVSFIAAPAYATSSASASLTDLTVTLYSLNPMNPSYVPTITFANSSYSSIYVNIYNGMNGNSISNYTYTPGSISINTSSSISSGAISATTNAAGMALSQSSSGSSSNGESFNASTSATSGAFTLSANTFAVFTAKGSATYSTTIGYDAITNQSESSSAFATLEAYGSNGYTGSQDSYDEAYVNTMCIWNPATSICGPSASNGTKTSTLQAFFANTTGNSQTGNLSASTNVYGYSLTAIGAVPEPETYAMLLAGLGLIGAAVKRRKAKQA